MMFAETSKKYLQFFDTKTASNYEQNYLWALDVVVETIEYVMTQPDIKKYYLHWSS